MSTPQHRVADYRKARDWVADNGGDMFPTFSSFEWFVRMHRDELLRSGELIIRRGSGGTLVGPRFDLVAVRIMQRNQLERAE